MLPALLVSIAGVGLLACALLLVRVREVSRVAGLKRHRSKEAGLSDLLNHAAVVGDGVVVCKDGALMAAWEYRAGDHASATDDRRAEVAYRINQAVGPLGNGWMWHVDAVCRPSPAYSAPGASHFPDRVSRALDEERRRAFEAPGNLFQAQFVLTVTFLPPPAAVRKLGALVVSDDRPQASAAEVAQGVLGRFNREVDALEHRLSTVFSMRRLKARRETDEGGGEAVYDDLLSHLQRCVTGLDHPVRLPKHPVFLDCVLGGQELWGGAVPQIGRRYVQAVAIEGFPSESYPGMLTALGELGIDCRWSTRFLFLDSWEALNHLERFRKRWKQQVVPFVAQVLRMPTGNVNEDAQSMAEDATAAKQGISAGLVSAGYYTSVVVLMGEDRAQVEADARKVEKTINHLGFSARVETFNTLDAFFGSLPGHGKENVRRPLIHTLNLAHLLPVSTVWTGEALAPCPFYQRRQPGAPPLALAVTTGNTPFRFNLHVGELGATLIFGPTRAGKTTLLGFLETSALRYREATVFVFDKDEGAYTLCQAVGGAHYRVGYAGDRLSFCPLQHLQEPEDRAWAVDWLETVVRLNGLPVTPARHNELARSIDNLHRSGHRTLTDFVRTVQDVEVREAFEAYTVEGHMGRLFDAAEDQLHGLSHFVVFEVGELMQLSPKFALPVLLYLFRRIERSLRGQPAFIVLDEAWVMLGHEVFREKIREWLKSRAKANCAVILATQNLSDAVRSGILDV
ncbi:MAG TPA: conjugal transfer protein TrbE, partial [Chthoniobacterales bacterium]